MKIKPIETQYKGYRFRSRLEARWAVFFETLGIDWLYEPEGFEKENTEGEMIRYLPDFYLPGTDTWIEVKGDNELLMADHKRLSELLDFGSFISDSYKTNGGLLLLGNIPNPVSSMIFHPLIQHHKGLVRTWSMFIPNGVASNEYRANIYTPFFERSPTYDLLGLQSVWFEGFNSSPEYFNNDPKFIDAKNYYPEVRKAYLAARSARFEHGENPGRYDDEFKGGSILETLKRAKGGGSLQ